MSMPAPGVFREGDSRNHAAEGGPPQAPPVSRGSAGRWTGRGRSPARHFFTRFGMVGSPDCAFRKIRHGRLSGLSFSQDSAWPALRTVLFARFGMVGSPDCAFRKIRHGRLSGPSFSQDSQAGFPARLFRKVPEARSRARLFRKIPRFRPGSAHFASPPPYSFA